MVGRERRTALSLRPLVTVLMPCRNAHVGFFEEAVESVFAQTTPRWELVVIDDRTEAPETRGALDALARRGDTRVRVVPSRSPRITGALNTGMHEARTPFVCALHCDDRLDEAAVETLDRAIAERPEVDYFYSSRVFIDEAARRISGVYRAREFELSDFERFAPVKALHCWRVAAGLAIGGMDETLGLHAGDDYDFPWRMAEAGFVFLALFECLYEIRDHREHYRLTTHVPLDVQILEFSRILRKHGVPEKRVAEELARRREGYLRQALFASEEDRRQKERQGFDARGGWRMTFEQVSGEAS
jgi:glycosyltransferase involved in cell wall biosynthesis